MDLEDLQGEVAMWAGRNFPDEEPWAPLLGAVEELGELCHAHLKGHQGIRYSRSEVFAKKVDAVGDVLVFLAHYCELNDLNFQVCMEVAWGEVKRRDWMKNAKDGQLPGQTTVDEQIAERLAEQLKESHKKVHGEK